MRYGPIPANIEFVPNAGDSQSFQWSSENEKIYDQDKEID